MHLLETYYNSSWIMRLYYDIDEEDELMEDLCEIACDYDNIDLCYIR